MHVLSGITDSAVEGPLRLAMQRFNDELRREAEEQAASELEEGASKAAKGIKPWKFYLNLPSLCCKVLHC